MTEVLINTPPQVEQPLPDPAEQPAPAAPDIFPDDGSRWNYTLTAVEVAQQRQAAEQAAGRSERPTIGRDSRLAGGVYEGSYGGEAIVVNYDEDPELIDQAIADVLAASTDRSGNVDKSRVLGAVLDTVTKRMPYDSRAVDSIFQRDLKGRNGAKVSLSLYIAQRAGECRHQALFAGIILEKLADRGILGGRPSVDRNMVRRGADGRYDGHAWVRYTNSANEVFILDVAQQRLDSLTNLMAEHQARPDRTWDYARPQDKARQQVETAHKSTGIDPYDPAQFLNDAGLIDRLPWD